MVTFNFQLFIFSRSLLSQKNKTPCLCVSVFQPKIHTL